MLHCLYVSTFRNLKVSVSHAGKSSGEVDLLTNWTLPRGQYESLEIQLTAVTESEDGENISETEIVTLSKVKSIHKIL